MSELYTLKHPLKRTFNAGKDNERVEELAELQLSRPKGKHVRASGRAHNDTEAGLIMIAGCTGLSDAEVDELDIADIEALSGIVENFTKPGRPTGRTDSET